MSVIIRLQNLPWSANALDIRQFFRGLSIPEGGVHIVGGELGDAFIAFSTDEDARQAFNLNGGKIKEVQIKLLLSSRTEMQKVIEAARNPLAVFMQKPTSIIPTAIPTIIPAVVPELLKRSISHEKEKRDRRRSRSRDRRDRSHSHSRERDRRERRRRDRSRSRSRDRRDRRRRDRSRSKDRRSKDMDRGSKERNKSEDKINPSLVLTPSPMAATVQKENNQAVVWTNNVPVVQTPTILNTLLPAQLRQSSGLVLSYRNGPQNPVDALNINRLVNSWNVNTGANQSQRPDANTRNFQDELKAVSNIIGNANRNISLESNSRSKFNRPTRVGGFDAPFEKASASLLAPTLKKPHPLDRLEGIDRSELQERSKYDRPQRPERYERERLVIKECCIELQPFYGGYGEIRKFFNGLFIHNNGIKFLNDELGKRTGVVYVRFASPTGKERALERNGIMLRGISIELNEIADEVFDNAVDRYQPPYNENKQENENSNSSFSGASESSYLLIQDLPLFTKEQDLIKIFGEYPLQKICLENKQRHIIAYIKFSTPKDAQRAAKERSAYTFDGKPLKISLCSDEDDYPATREPDEVVDLVDDEDEPEALDSIETDCVSLSGLPKKTTDRDVSDFFSDVAIVPKKIHLMSSNFGFNGQAYCEFLTIQDAQTALQKNGLPLGSGIVKVKPIFRSEMEGKIGLAIPRDPLIKPLFNNPSTRPLQPKTKEILPVHKKYQTPSKPINYGISVDNKTCVVASNVNNYTSRLDNKSYEIPPINCNVKDNDGNYGTPSGQQNNTMPPTDFNNLPDNENYDMLSDVENYDTPPEAENYDATLDDNNYEMIPDDESYDMEPDNENYNLPHNFPQRIENVSYEMSSRDKSFDRSLDHRNYQTHQTSGDGRKYETHNRHFESSAHNRNFESKPPTRHFDTPSAPRPMPPPLMSLTRIPPIRRPFPPLITPNNPDTSSPGCTILMENVPYKAGLEEILQFFEGFEVLADNVLRRYNDNGTPTGEAKVIFNSKEEAYDALQACNLHKLRERTIYLSQC